MRTHWHRIATVALVFALGLPGVGAQGQSTADTSLFARLAAVAPAGNADAKYHLGMFLNNGIGTTPDRAAAFRQFSEAAEAGHPLAAYKLGCYFAGQFPGVVPLDLAQALKFKLRAAEAGYQLAQLDVGTLYARQGDSAQAARWWEQASRQGDLEATARLAHALSVDANADRAKTYALMRLLKTMTPSAPRELLTQMDALEARLTDSEKTSAAAIGAAWQTGKTPLTLQAQQGRTAVETLLASLEGRR